MPSLVVFVLVLSVLACTPAGEENAAPDSAAPESVGTDAAAVPEVPARVKQAADIARAIQADPESMDRILDGEGMTREQFEDLLYEIAADPVLSEAYVRELGS